MCGVKSLYYFTCSESRGAYKTVILRIPIAILRRSISRLNASLATLLSATIIHAVHNSILSVPIIRRRCFTRSTTVRIIFTTRFLYHRRMGMTATVIYKRFASLIAEKYKKPYSKTILWIRCRLSYSLLRSAIMCLRGSRSSRHNPAHPGPHDTTLHIIKSLEIPLH